MESKEIDFDYKKHQFKASAKHLVHFTDFFLASLEPPWPRMHCDKKNTKNIGALGCKSCWLHEAEEERQIFRYICWLNETFMTSGL